MITPRELQILQLVAQEYSTKEIASMLYIGIETVKSHRKNLKEKLKVRNSAGLVRSGFELGLLVVTTRSYIAIAS